MQNQYLQQQQIANIEERKSKSKICSKRNARKDGFRIIFEKIKGKDAEQRLHEAFKILLKDFF